MSNISTAENAPSTNEGWYEQEYPELVKLAREKPTLQMINATDAKSIEEWEQSYPELWLFIAVTREDEHGIYEGKLIATAENSVEFLDLGRHYDKQGSVNLTTRGIPLGPQPLFIPTCVVAEEGREHLSQ